MKQGTVKFSKEFITPIGLKEWVGIELEFDMGTEHPEDVLDRAKEVVEGWQMKKQGNYRVNPDNTFTAISSAPPTILPVIDKAEERQIGITAEMILSSPDKTILNSYRLIIKGKPELERAFELRNDELNRMGYK